jgi:hypothetical protein
MLPKEFRWRRQSSSWGRESWLLAYGRPVGIVSELDGICYLSHESAQVRAGWTTERAESVEQAVTRLERWALANARRTAGSGA